MNYWLYVHSLNHLSKTNDYFIIIIYNNDDKNIDWAISFLCHIPYLYNLEKQVIILIFLTGKLKIKSFNVCD